MEQQRALSALEPYILLSKSATSPRAAADLIAQATSAPHTYIFAELLQTSNIQKLRDSAEYAGHLKLLEIFAWGTWADYNEHANALPSLNDAQRTKLQLLTLLPLSTTAAPKATDNALSYAHLQSALSLPTPLALESLVTTAIYSGLLTAHLDPLHQTVRVSAVAPLRDLPPNSIPVMLSTLDAWDQRCGAVLGDIEGRVEMIRAAARERKAREIRRGKMFEEAVKEREAEVASGGGGKGGKRAAPMMSGAGGEGLAEAMELDDGAGGLRSSAGKGVKRVGRGLGLR